MPHLLTCIFALSLGVALVNPTRLAAEETSGETKEARTVLKRVVPPRLSPSRVARRAMKQYDANKDGKIDRRELGKCPTLKSAVEMIDKNGDGVVTAGEIADRVQDWLDSKLGRMCFACTVTLDGKPLQGALVRFVPERFLGKAFQAATGTTDEHGIAVVSIPLTGPDDPPGIAPGFYRVEISKTKNGKETIAAQYNTKTVLGQEIAMDAAGLAGESVFVVELAKDSGE